MLGILRKRMRWILIATIIFIIPVFVIFYGPRQPGPGAGESRHAGRVYGRNISYREYYQALQWAHIQARMRYGDRLEDIIQFLNLEQQAWQDVVLYEAAMKNNIVITDRELASFITSLPMFLSEDGVFDSRLYHNILSYGLGLRPEEFESFIRRSMAVSRLREKASDSVRVADSEAKKFYALLNEEAKAQYVKFPAFEFRDRAAVDDEMLEEYFKANPEEFRQPEERKIEFSAFEPDPEKEEASEEEIASYYRVNLDEFAVEPEDESAETGHEPLEEVYSRIEKQIKQRKALARARAEAEELMLDLEEGFIFWEDTDREKTEFFSSAGAGFLPRALASYAFEAEPGALSGPFQADGKFYLLKVTGRNPSHLPLNYRSVRDELAERVLEIESQRLAEKKSAEFLREVLEHGDLLLPAGEHGFEVLATEYFTRSGRIPGMGMAGEFAERAFQLSEEQPFAAAPLPGGSAVMQLVEIKPVDYEEFEEEKERFKSYVLSEKREKIFSDWFNLILAESEAKFYIEPQNHTGSF